MKKAIIIGGGFSGCTVGFLLSKKGWHVEIFEKNSHLGGGCWTRFYGNHPYTLGPRHILEKDDFAFSFLRNFINIRKIKIETWSYVEQDGEFYTYPIHIDDIQRMPEKEEILNYLKERPEKINAKNFEEYWIFSVGRILYEKFINNYSKKMWDITSNKEIDDFSFSPKGVAIARGERNIWPDYIVAHPSDLSGYNNYFLKATKDCKVFLNARISMYDLDNLRILVDDEWIKGDVIISTTSPDELFDYCYGTLPFMGREVIPVVLPIEKILPGDVCFLYYTQHEPITRIVEYKKLYGYKHKHTLLGIEIPRKNGKWYPYPMKKYQELAQKYIDELPERVFSIGRLGKYKYLGISDVIRDAFKIAEIL